MNFRILFFLLLLLLSGQPNLLFAQSLCGTPSPTEQEKSILLAHYQSFIKNSKNTRNTFYRVAIKANVIQSTNFNQPFLSETDVRQILENANVYLRNINIELYLLNNQVNFAREDKFYELKLNDEAELRKKYDVTNAINIYFVKNITLPDLSILGGYTNLPSSSAISNRILFSFFERTRDDYENLRNKLFLHEIGHYFGLLHTFQDSNNPEIFRRELVTRGTGSNCYMMGDQLCDTPADPYERFPNALFLDCNASLPTYLIDAYGEMYAPPINNLMSYNKNCGHVFTEQQYQKMQASFSIRFSPAAEYQIVARTPNFIEIHEFDKKVYCLGDSLKINYELEGLFENNNQLSVEISDKSGTVFSKIESRKVGNQLFVKIPNNFPEGDNYRVRITASRPETVSSISEHFAIKSYATAFLTASRLQVNASESVEVFVNFTGSGAWSFSLSDGTNIINTRENPYKFKKTYEQTTNLTFNSAQNVCGEMLLKQGLAISVIQPQIQTAALSTTNFCRGQNIQITLASLGRLATDDQYVLQISDAQGNNFIDLPTQISTFSLSAQIPDNQPLGSGFKLKVSTKKAQLFSSPIGPISIIDNPLPPKTTPLTLCQNTLPNPLTAEGSLLRWYTEENTNKFQNSIMPVTSREGNYTFFVSQTNIYGCESKKSRLDVVVKPIPITLLSGDKTIMIGDSALLKVDVFVGEFPVLVTLSDGRDFTITKNPLIIQVRPKKTTTYAIRQTKNTCGIGSATGTAKIVVLEPLAEEDIFKDFLNIYPNPISDKINIHFKNFFLRSSKIIFSDLSGKVFLEKKFQRIEANQLETFDLSNFPMGNYLLLFSTENQSFSRKIAIVR